MADHQHRAAVSGQVVFQPGDALQVQVVRRLVQEQQVRLRQQHPAQAQARPLAAGEPAGLHVLVLPQLQACQHALHGGAPAVAIAAFKLPRQRVVPSAQAPQRLRIRPGFRHLLLEAAQLRFHLPLGFKHALQRFEHRLLPGQLTLLGKITDLQALLHVHGAAVRGLLPGDDLHQRALAAAVHADQAHPLALLQGKRNRLQHLVGPEALLYFLKGEYDHCLMLFLSV